MIRSPDIEIGIRDERQMKDFDLHSYGHTQQIFSVHFIYLFIFSGSNFLEFCTISGGNESGTYFSQLPIKLFNLHLLIKSKVVLINSKHIFSAVHEINLSLIPRSNKRP